MGHSWQRFLVGESSTWLELHDWNSKQYACGAMLFQRWVLATTSFPSRSFFRRVPLTRWVTQRPNDHCLLALCVTDQAIGASDGSAETHPHHVRPQWRSVETARFKSQRDTKELTWKCFNMNLEKTRQHKENWTKTSQSVHICQNVAIKSWPILPMQGWTLRWVSGVRCRGATLSNRRPASFAQTLHIKDRKLVMEKQTNRHGEVWEAPKVLNTCSVHKACITCSCSHRLLCCKTDDLHWQQHAVCLHTHPSKHHHCVAGFTVPASYTQSQAAGTSHCALRSGDRRVASSPIGTECCCFLLLLLLLLLFKLYLVLVLWL